MIQSTPLINIGKPRVYRNFVKAALPRLLTDTGQNILGSLGVETEDTKGNLRNIVDIYTDVANAMKNLSEAEQINVVKGLGGVYHQTRLQVLLDDLGSVDSMYRSMLDTAENSEGSALQENEKYMQSLEARINLVRVEVEKLAVAIGEAFLTDGMISFLKASTDALGVLTALTKTFGVLPVLVGGGASAIYLLSHRFRDLTTSVINSIKAYKLKDIETRKLTLSTSAYSKAKQSLTGITVLNTTTLRTNSTQMAILNKSTQAATVSTNMFKGALRGLLASTGVGAVFALVGFGLEKMVGAMGDGITASEELESANRILLDSYSNNQTEIDNLVRDYSALEDVISKPNPDVDKMSEYKDVMNELGGLLPELVTGEDQYGNKIILSSSATEIKIGLLKEQLAIQKEINEEQARQENQESIDINTKVIEDAKKYAEDTLKNLTNSLEGVSYNGLSSEFKVDFIDSEGKPIMKTLDDLASKTKEVKDKLKDAKTSGSQEDVDILNRQIDRLEHFYGIIDKGNNDVAKSASTLKLNYIDSISNTVNSNEKLSESTRKLATDFSSNMLNISKSFDVSNLGEGIENILSGDSASSFISTLSAEFGKLDSATSETFDSMSSSVQLFIDSLPESLSTSGLSDTEIKAIQNSLQGMLDSSITEFNSFDKAMKDSGMTAEQMRIALGALGEEGEVTADSVSELASNLYDLKDATEQIVGVSQKGVEAIGDLLWQYDMLTTQLSSYTQQEIDAIMSSDNLTSAQQQVKDILLQRMSVMEQLSSVYPDLLDKDNKAIALSAKKREYIEIENKANKTLLEAYKLSRDGKLTAEQNMTLSSAQGTKARIDNLRKEISAIEVIQQKYLETLNAVSESSVNSIDSATQESLAIRNYKKSQSNASSLKSELDTLMNSLNTQVGGVQSIIDTTNKASSSSSSAAKKASEATKNSIYVTDQYRNALDKINLALEKQQDFTSKQVKGSQAYRNSLQKEIKLQKEKIALMEKQTKSISSQISSGNIKQTGMITDSTSSSSNRNLNGWGGKITDTYGTYRSIRNGRMHTGVDIAGTKGTRLDSNINGKVVSVGKTALSGNYVQILDEKGLKHFYGHLDSIAVAKNQIIEIGQKIGAIGNTGNSTGSHLHYQITGKDGKTFNPIDYVNSAKKSQTVTSSSKNNAANKAQAKDQATQDLLALQQSIINEKNLLDELMKAWRQSPLIAFENRKKVLDDNLSYEEAKLQTLDKSSVRYNKTLDIQTDLIKRKQKVNDEEIAYLEKLIRSEGIAVHEKEEYRQQLRAAKLETIENTVALREMALAYLEVHEARYNEKFDDLDFSLQRSKAIQSMYDVGSADYMKEYESQIKYINGLISGYEKFIKETQEKLKDVNLLPQDIKDANEKLEDATLALLNWKLELLNTEKDIKETIKTTSNDLIDSYKAYIEEKKQAHMKSIDDELKAENKRHDNVIKNYENERKAFQEVIDDKIRQLDRAEAERDYNMEIDDLEAERKKTQDQINLLQLDNSHEAKAKRKELQEQLSKIDKDISEKRHDRDIDLQKQGLSDLSEAKNEEIDEKVKLENDYHDEQLENIDELKEYWEQYYTDLLNDERKFDKIRQDIAKGNIANIKTEFGGFLTWLEKTQPDLENTLNGTMTAVGTTIRTNIIDNLKKALGLLDEINGVTGTGTGKYGSSEQLDKDGVNFTNPDPTKNTNGIDSMSTADMKVLLAKFMIEKIIPTVDNESRKKLIKDRAYDLAEQGRKGGSPIKSTESLKTVLEGFGETDIMRLSQYLQSNFGGLQTKEYQDMIKAWSNRMKNGMASLDSGGFIKRIGSGVDGKGGGLSIIHPNEVVETPYDVKQLVQHSSIVERITKMMTPMINKLPILNSITNGLSGGDTITVQFGDVYGATREQAKNFADELMGEFKRIKGV